MRNAVVVAAQRTPVGKIRKALAGFDAADLGAMAAIKCIEKAGIDPAIIDECLMGNLFNVNHGCIARKVALTAGLPFEVPGVAIERQCSSSLNAVAYGAMLIQTGNIDVALAGGVESYSQMPLMIKNPQMAYPSNLEFVKYDTHPPHLSISMIQTAENLAKKYHLTREECDEFALRSHQNAARAWKEGLFDEQVFPVEIPQKKGAPIIFNMDECVRADATMESLAKVRPVLEGGIVTAGNASPMNDGAAMVLLMSEEKAKELGLEPLAKVTGFASAGVDPSIMGFGPVPASQKLLKKAGLTVDDIDLWEINEAFAAQSIPCVRELNIPIERVNVNGGAISIGHPNAASGGILVARMVYEMRRRDAKRGIVTFCCGGGQGFSVLFERD